MMCLIDSSLQRENNALSTYVLCLIDSSLQRENNALNSYIVFD